MCWVSVLISFLLFCVASTPPLLAAEMRYVESQNEALNMRSGPGMEYAVVSRLPHGTKVFLHERWGLWAKVTSPLNTEGWVLQRYLATTPPADPEEQVDMSLGQERRRFNRLQRKGVIEVKRPGGTGLLGLAINPLVWRRLTPDQQYNFLQRAQRFFGGSLVEMRNQQNQELLARLTVTGAFEPADEPSSVPTPLDATGSEGRSEMPVSPADTGR